jgi:hypothetical protein
VGSSCVEVWCALLTKACVCGSTAAACVHIIGALGAFQRCAMGMCEHAHGDARGSSFSLACLKFACERALTAACTVCPQPTPAMCCKIRICTKYLWLRPRFYGLESPWNHWLIKLESPMTRFHTPQINQITANHRESLESVNHFTRPPKMQASRCESPGNA